MSEKGKSLKLQIHDNHDYDYDYDGKKTQYRDIPYHLIIDNILPRLPVKTLIRFKCVSKNWLHTISSNDFTKAHLRLSSSSSSNQSVMMFGTSYYNAPNKPPYSLLLLNYDEHKEEKQLQLVEVDPVFKERLFTLVGCCNGLLCLCLGMIIRIWNPATHSYRDVLLPEGGPHIQGVNGFGFGYASSIDDYKIMFFRSLRDDSTDVQVYLFSLRTGAWRRVSSTRGIRVPRDYININRIVWKGESLCWLFGNLDGIVSFDLVTQQWTKIPIPSLDGCYNNNVHLRVINGNLALLGRQYMKGPRVWIFTKAGVTSSWQILNTFLDRRKSLVGILDNGKCLVQCDDETNKLDVIDPTQDHATQQLSRSSTIYFPYSVANWDTFTYVESLILPFGLANSN